MLLRPCCSLASSDYVIQAKRAEVEAEVAKLEAELEAARKEREAWYARHLMLVFSF